MKTLIFYSILGIVSACGSDSTLKKDANDIEQEEVSIEKENKQVPKKNDDATKVNNQAKIDPPPSEPNFKITLLCESKNNQEAVCPVDNGTIVTSSLKKQLSKTECVKDQNWFMTSNGIRVINGCRAEFELEASKYDCHKLNNCKKPETEKTPETNTPTEGVVGVNEKGQPTINGIATPTACGSNDPEVCTQHCTVLVDGKHPGRFVGDTNGTDNDLPTFRFPKKGDAYCGGVGGLCSVQVACRNKKHNLFVTFKNPGAPASGEAHRDGPYRYQTNGWLPGGYSYGFAWKAAGVDGKLVIMLGGHLQKDGQ